MSGSVNHDKSWRLLNITYTFDKVDMGEDVRERENWNGMPSIFYGLIPSIHDKQLDQHEFETNK